MPVTPSLATIGPENVVLAPLVPAAVKPVIVAILFCVVATTVPDKLPVTLPVTSPVNVPDIPSLATIGPENVVFTPVEPAAVNPAIVVILPCEAVNTEPVRFPLTFPVNAPVTPSLATIGPENVVLAPLVPAAVKPAIVVILPCEAVNTEPVRFPLTFPVNAPVTPSLAIIGPEKVVFVPLVPAAVNPVIVVILFCVEVNTVPVKFPLIFPVTPSLATIGPEKVVFVPLVPAAVNPAIVVILPCEAVNTFPVKFPLTFPVNAPVTPSLATTGPENVVFVPLVPAAVKPVIVVILFCVGVNTVPVKFPVTFPTRPPVVFIVPTAVISSPTVKSFPTVKCLFIETSSLTKTLPFTDKSSAMINA